MKKNVPEVRRKIKAAAIACRFCGYEYPALSSSRNHGAVCDQHPSTQFATRDSSQQCVLARDCQPSELSFAIMRMRTIRILWNMVAGKLASAGGRRAITRTACASPSGPPLQSTGSSPSAPTRASTPVWTSNQ